MSYFAGPQTTAPRSMVCFEDESAQTWSGQIARWIYGLSSPPDHVPQR